MVKQKSSLFYDRLAQLCRKLSIKAWVGACLVLGLLSPDLQAREEQVPGSRYLSARGAAMGDAFLPLADDGASALFYNPAAIGRLRSPTVELANIQLHGNADFGAVAGFDAFKAFSLDSYEPTLSKNQNYMPGIGATWLPNFSTRYFAAGLLMHSQVMAQSNGTDVFYRSRYQLIPAIGTGIRLASGVVRLGYSLQWINQAFGERTVPVSSDPLGYNQGIQQGSGFSHTFGFAFTLPYVYLPALNIVVRNVGGLKYSDYTLYSMAKNSAGTPVDEPMTYDASFSIQPQLGRGIYWNWVFQYRDITNTSDVPILGRAAIGMELSFRDRVFIRGGWGSGYPHAGIGFKNDRSDVSFTWHSEDIGPGYHDFRDVKFILQYQMKTF